MVAEITSLRESQSAEVAELKARVTGLESRNTELETEQLRLQRV